MSEQNKQSLFDLVIEYTRKGISKLASYASLKTKDAKIERLGQAMKQSSGNQLAAVIFQAAMDVLGVDLKTDAQGSSKLSDTGAMKAVFSKTRIYVATSMLPMMKLLHRAGLYNKSVFDAFTEKVPGSGVFSKCKASFFTALQLGNLEQWVGNLVALSKDEWYAEIGYEGKKKAQPSDTEQTAEQVLAEQQSQSQDNETETSDSNDETVTTTVTSDSNDTEQQSDEPSGAIENADLDTALLMVADAFKADASEANLEKIYKVANLLGAILKGESPIAALGAFNPELELTKQLTDLANSR